jgi:subtilisin family serine protease
MMHRQPGRLFMSILLFLGMFLLMVPAAKVESKEGLAARKAMQEGIPSQPPQEKVVTGEKGLEKLSPDLRSLLEALPVSNQAAAMAAATDAVSGDPLLVSAMIEPGADVGRFFSQSVVSREVAGVQWITGELAPEQLRKLASISEVIGVVSNNTYQTADAPELDTLSSLPKPMDIKQARALFAAGGARLLRERALQMRSTAKKKAVPGEQQVVPRQSSTAVPGLLDIHDVQRAHSEGYTGDKVVVGLVDTGVDFSHPDLVGTQAVIRSGAYAGWPYAYDTLSGYHYALNTSYSIDPYNFANLFGETNYVRTLPVEHPDCSTSTCTAKLLIAAMSGDTFSASFTWPKTSKSGTYYYSIYPDVSLILMTDYLGIGYPEGWLLPPILVLSDESTAGVYDTTYVDINFDHILNKTDEKLTRDDPVAGVDIDTGSGKDGVWDLSAGMLTWISDGLHHPPGVDVLYPDILKKDPPAAGRLLAFVNDQDGHGTRCASLIAGQGKITDPRGLGASNPLYAGGGDAGGVGGSVITSMAKDAKIAAFQNGLDMPFDAWILAAYGMDGVANSGDEVNISSNSWGDSSVIADGWDPISRFGQQLSYKDAPTITFLVATGNGGPGYGTRTSPGGGSIIDVGASTAYGAVRGFEEVDTTQFLYGEVQPWSNRGPGSLGDIAPDIVAVGAFGTAAAPLNRAIGDGERAYDVFGGTSMSTPVTAGGLAVIYQAFFAHHNRWPTWQEARDILFGAASDLGYDVLVQGAGNMQVSRAVDVALERAPGVSPSQWQAGSYRGVKYQAFPSILHPGEQDTQTFTVQNPSQSQVTVKADSTILQSFHEETFTYAFSTPAPDVKHELPVFLKDLTSLISQYNPDMIRAQVAFPFTNFDVDNNGYADNWWQVYFYDWKDLNGDKNLWTDTNYDGRVDEGEIDIEPTSGLYEFNRFTYGSPQSDTLEASLGSRELTERHDGVFLGLGCYFCGESTSLQVRVTFYHKVSWNWMQLSNTELTIPGQNTADITATLSVPADTNPGAYEGAVEVNLDGNKSVLPVIVNVASNSTTFGFGSPQNPGQPYDNSRVFGGFNWNWRYESGDWRIFYNDIPDGSAGVGKSMVFDSIWGGPTTDIDTWLLGPVESPYSQDLQKFFGPKDLPVSGGSVDAYAMFGRFRWKTNTGYSREVVSSPVQDGLNMISLHNILNSGLQLAEEYAGRVYQLTTNPGKAVITAEAQGNDPAYLSGSQKFTFTSTADIQEGIQIQAFGMSAPIDLPAQTVLQDNPSDYCSASWVYKKQEGGLEIHNGGSLEITTSSATSNMDLDLFLFEDNGNKQWNCGQDKLKTYSINADSNERVKVLFPADGIYWIAVHGNYVPGGQKLFDIRIRSIAGSDLTLEDFPTGVIHANQPVVFTTNYHGKYAYTTPTELDGFLLIGLPSVQDMLEVPIQVQPDILLYPAPAFFANAPWVEQTPEWFNLIIQNQGVNAETVEANIQIPAELLYEPDSAIVDVPGGIFTYNAGILNWTGPLEGGKKATIRFQASAQSGAQPAHIEVKAQVHGKTSGQDWMRSTWVWVNKYGLLVPIIRR